MKLLISIISILFATGTAKINNNTVDVKKVDIKESSFASFLSHFPLEQTPYKIGYNEIEEFSEKLTEKHIKESASELDYSAMLHYLPYESSSMFSRIGKLADIYPIARFYLTKDKVGVIYVNVPRSNLNKLKIKNAELSKTKENKSTTDFKNLHYRMFVYDLDGNIQSVEGAEDPEFRPISIASRTIDHSYFGELDESGTVTSTKYKNEWENDPFKFGVANNKVVSFVKLEQKLVSLIGDDIATLDKGSQVVSTP